MITQVSATIGLVRTSIIYLDQTIHTNQGKQGLQAAATIPLGQAIAPTALEARVAQEVQVGRRQGPLVVAEDKINDLSLIYENSFTTIFYYFFDLLENASSKLRSGLCH